jgi:tryptophan 2,3-dioxygenase
MLFIVRHQTSRTVDEADAALTASTALHLCRWARLQGTGARLDHGTADYAWDVLATMTPPNTALRPISRQGSGFQG